MLTALSALSLWAQDIVQVGKGSYAAYAPLAKSRTADHSGDQSQYMQYRKLYIREAADRPIPTNDWWTDLINADRERSAREVTGHLWSYPQYVQGMKYGIDVHYPKYWVDNGTEMKAQSKLMVKCGDTFSASHPMAESWSDWTVTFSEESGSQRLITTLAHGVPFTWIEMTGINPVITAVKTDNDGADNLLRDAVSVAFMDGAGNALTGSQTLSQFVVSISNAQTSDLYGVYLPEGTTVTFTDGQAHVVLGANGFVVTALLKRCSDLTSYAPYAYSKPTDTQVSWNYTQSNGTLTTRWRVSATDLRTGAATSNVLQGFIPHHYRRNSGGKANGTLTDLTYFSEDKYLTPRGRLRLVASNDVSIAYKFTGMLPWYPVPTDADEHGFNTDIMLQMLSHYAQTGSFGGDTYWGGKGLTQMALNMSFAREMGNEELFRQCHDRLKESLVNWLTYTPGESEYFFARDPRYGGLIGYNTSYDSDTYNDHHFHYGYFTLAAAMLALVDDDFKQNYGEMIKLVARDYNNYKRDTWSCFLRMMDPWAGHCYAGGMGDGAGNGQESTSESMQGWGGMYLLGVALGDDELRDAGIFGWVSESRATAEYWFDRHGETIDNDFHTSHATDKDEYNIDYSKFVHKRDNVIDYIQPWSSNLTSHGVGWWTWFGGDPVFMQGIQWMPISPALDYLGEDKAFADWDYQYLMRIKEHKGWDGQGGIGDADLRDSDWGNVVLAYRQWSDPDDAAAIFDEGWTNNWGTMKSSSTNGITYFVTHSHRTYGDIQWDVTADYPTARTYKKGDVTTHVAYNPTDAPITVHFSDAAVLEVPARQLKVEGVTSAAFNYVYPVDDSEPDLRERLVMKNLALGKACTASSYENAGTLKEYATDGKTNTRWSSATNDGEWLQVDLGENAHIYQVCVRWEASYASEYRIELRTTENGEVTYSKSGNGKREDWTELALDDHEGRYVRLVGVKRASQYGTSLYELEVYGRPASAADNDLMGVEITCANDVLKQGQPAALTIQGYDFAKNAKAVTASWSSDDGTFIDNNFTPTEYGIVTVKATVDGMTAVKMLPVEEALKLASVTFEVPGIMVKDQPTAFIIEGKDQFGAPYQGEATFDSDATLTVNAADKTITPTATGQYAVTAHMGGVDSEAQILVINSAANGPATLSDKVPVFVGDEESPMNFQYNGGSERTGSSFLLTPNCRAIYVKQLGTCGFGALGNIDLEGANMLHADVYPINDAPLFSIHIEGAPGNKEYAKALTGGQWNTIDLPITNTTVNWLFFSFNDYKAGSNAALIANVYFYTETGDRIYVSDPDSKGISTVTTFGTGVNDSNVAQFLNDVAALPKTTTAIDLSHIALNNSTPVMLETPNNPNVIILLDGNGGDDNAASSQIAKLTNTHNLAYNAGGWILPMKSTGFKVIFEDGYPVLPMNFGRNATLTFSRTIAADSYATICLPRTVAVPAGIVVYELASVSTDNIRFNKVDGTLTAYKPYLLRNTTEAPIELAINGMMGNIELARSVNERSTTADNVKLVGNFQQFHVTGVEGYAAFRSDGTLAWLSNSGTTVGAFRAYLSGITAEQLTRGISFDDEEATSIGEELRVKSEEFLSLESMARHAPAAVFFDLQGRKVAQPKKGLYIVNGKKVVIR